MHRIRGTSKNLHIKIGKHHFTRGEQIIFWLEDLHQLPSGDGHKHVVSRHLFFGTLPASAIEDTLVIKRNILIHNI